MGLQNTDNDYGLIAKLFHWLIAVMILGLLPVGLLMVGMENSPFKFEVYAMHKSFGLLVFFLGLGRILWRFISPAPDHMENHKYWEVTLAKAAHFWLYVCIIGMPLSGWLMSSAGEYPVPFFGIQMPALMGKDAQAAGLFKDIHEILGFTLMAILALHIAGALKHHLIDKDETLQRMTAYKKGLMIPVIVVVLAGLSYGGIGAAFLSEDEEEPATIAVSDTVVKDNPVLPHSNHAWSIVPQESKLFFEAVLYKTPFTATFGDFKGTIIFNSDDLPSSFADIVISMDALDSQDLDRNKNMKGADWFDVVNFPQSRFVSKSFERGGDGQYMVVGDVIIRDVTMPLIIPFSLDIKGNRAHMRGQFTLDRTNFGVGMGQWNSDETVSKTVKVIIDLIAVQ